MALLSSVVFSNFHLAYLSIFSQKSYLTLSAVWYIAIGSLGSFYFRILGYLVIEALKCSYWSEFCSALTIYPPET